ncbi:hypothetical protein B0H14DRAFT_2557425 [Mycena olivaceomarginata]|nr:hypothetical protein B0H14DRAFT_2557425 [Mycena olivaceomarginata]
MATDDIEIFPKTELQEDWCTQSTIGPSSAGGLAINLDRNGKLAVSYISDGSIFTARRNLDTDGNSLRTWTVEDTHFPIGEDNNIYVLDCSSNFARWECTFFSSQGISPAKLSLFTMRNNALNIAVLTTNGLIYIVDPITKEWFLDVAPEFTAAPVLDYKVGSAFTQTHDNDNSQWGYVVSGNVYPPNYDAGVAMIAADPDLPRVVTYAAIGGAMPRVKPLVFAIDEGQKATYLQANGNGTFSAVLPLGADRRFTHLEAIFKTGNDSDGSKIEWIGVFFVLCASVNVYGLDTLGNVWHTRNDAYEGARSSAVQMINGYIFVSKWETPSIITSKPVKSFDVAVEMDGGGHAYVVTDLDFGSTTASLEAYVQDMASTTWTKSPISTVNHKAPEVYKRNVYYVEIAVILRRVSPKYSCTGLTVKITAPEYCQIDANGEFTLLLLLGRAGKWTLINCLLGHGTSRGKGAGRAQMQTMTADFPALLDQTDREIIRAGGELIRTGELAQRRSGRRQHLQVDPPAVLI